MRDKRIVSLILVFSMCLSLIQPSFAATAPKEVPTPAAVEAVEPVEETAVETETDTAEEPVSLPKLTTASTTVTTPLAFNPGETVEGPGYRWDNNVLTLTDFNMNYNASSTSASSAIRLPGGATVVLNGTSSIQCQGSAMVALNASEGSLTILGGEGEAKLSIVSKVTDNSAAGIRVSRNGTLTVAENAWVELNTSGDGVRGYGANKTLASVVVEDRGLLTQKGSGKLMEAATAQKFVPAPATLKRVVDDTVNKELIAVTLPADTQYDKTARPILFNENREEKFSYTYTDLAAKGFVEAGTYHVWYTYTSGKTPVEVGSFKVLPREIVVHGIQAVDRIYNGKNGAPLDYSEVVYSRPSKQSGEAVMKDDKLIPNAIGVFLRNSKEQDCSVAYVNDKVENGKVCDKPVRITNIDVTNHNYKVIAEESQNASRATIKPKSLKDEDGKMISATLAPTNTYWNEAVQDVAVTVKDSEVGTLRQKSQSDAQWDWSSSQSTWDYTVSGVTSYHEIRDEMVVEITGKGNYCGTITRAWNINKVVRSISIKTTNDYYDGYDYDGFSFQILAPALKNVLFSAQASVKPTENVRELDLEQDVRVTYVGRGETDYPESETAPTDAGDYTVRVTVAETAHYTAAEMTQNFTIRQKPVALAWSGWEDLVYDGEAHVVEATVTNPVTRKGAEEPDSVVVTVHYYGEKAVAAGSSAAAVPVEKSAEVPVHAGKYTAQAVALSDPNYTLTTAADMKQAYSIQQRVLGLVWDQDEFIYNAAMQAPKAEAVELVEGDECDVTVRCSGKDVFGTNYNTKPQLRNVSADSYTAKAVALSNSDYRFPDDIQIPFVILPLDLSLLAQPEEFWVKSHDYDGFQYLPQLVWSKGGFGEDMVLNRDYEAFNSTSGTEPSDEDRTITVTGIGNYCGEYVDLPWNINRLENALAITNFAESYVYGDALPEKELYTWTNTELVDVNEADAIATIRYCGVERSGKEYDSGVNPVGSGIQPTQAGEYTVTVTIPQTAHYYEGSATLHFTILPKEIAVSGLKVEKKYYDGTTKGDLDISKAVYDGMLEGDALAVSGTVTFESKDVSPERKAAISDLLFIPTAQDDLIYFNYILKEGAQQDEAVSAITPAPVTVVGGIKGVNKAYDGTLNAALDTTEAVFAGVVEGESLAVSASGSFQKSGNEPAPKDVLMVGGAPAAKKIRIFDLAISSANDATTDVNNYVLAVSGNQSMTTAVITPIQISIQKVSAKSRIFDNTDVIELDWSKSSIEGVLSGDTVFVMKKDSTGIAPSKNVVLDSSGKAAPQPVDIAVPTLGGMHVNNYTLSPIDYVTAVIKPKSVTRLDWSFESIAYDGLPHEPVVTIAAGRVEGDTDDCFGILDTSLSSNARASIQAINVGSYLAKVVGLTNINYQLDAENLTSIYTIMPRTLSAEWSRTALGYTGTPQLPTVTLVGIVEGDEVLPVVKAADGDDATNIGSHTAIVNQLTGADAENYVVSSSAQYIIQHKIAPFLNVSDVPAKIVGDQDFQIQATCNVSGVALVYSSDNESVVTVDQSGKAHIVGVGVANITVTLPKAIDDSYSELSQTVSVRVGKRGSSITVPQTSFEKTYGDAGFSLNAAAVGGKLSYTSSSDHVLRVDDKGNVTIIGSGSAVITVHMDAFDEYEAAEDVIVTVEVNGRDISNAEVTLGKALTYNGTEQTMKVESVLVDGEEVDYTVSGNTATHAGTYTLTITGKGDFTGEIQREFTVAKRKATVTADSFTKTFGDKDQPLSYAASGILSGDTVSVALERDAGENVGSYTIRCSAEGDNGDYDLTFVNGKATIKAKSIAKGSVKLSDSSYYFDRSAKKPTASLTVGGVKLDKAQFTVSYKNNVQVGTATVTLTGKGNYTGTVSKTFKIVENKTLNTNSINSGLQISMTGKNVTVKWGKVTNADGYEVFFYTCGSKKVTTRNVGKKTTVSAVFKNQNDKKHYNAYVKAYRMVNGKKVYVASSLRVHVAGSSTKFTNAKSVRVKDSRQYVSIGATSKLAPSVKKVKAKYQLMNHTAAYRYWSTNTGVATVSASGVITGKKAGTCKVYVMAENGRKKAVTVTVGK